MTTETTGRVFRSEPDDVTTKRRIYASDVRVPTTLDECEAALDLCDSNIVGLSDLIAQRRADGEPFAHCESILATWERKRSELAYVDARLRAPAPKPAEPSMDLALARRRIVDLEAALAKATAKASRPDASQRLIDDLERQKRDLAARLDALVSHTQSTQGASESKAKKHAAAIHNLTALCFAAIVEMVEAGASLTPLAAFISHKMKRDTPEGYFDAWCADALRFIVPSARQNFAENAEVATRMIEDELERRRA